MKNISYFILLALTFAFGCGSDDPANSSEKQIISFTLAAADHTFLDEDLSGTIDHENGTVTLVLPPASDLAALIPNIQLSPGASVSPGSGAEQDFSAPVTYTITAEDGSTQGYTVTISVALHSDKAILSFDFLTESNSTIKSEINGIINNNDLSVSLEVPYNSDRSALTPNFTLSPGASSSPASGEVQDFTNPVTYTITAEDGSTNDYKVSVGYAESQAQVLSFSFLAEENDDLFVDVEGIIKENLISLEVPATTEVNNLKGQVTLSSGATTSIDLQTGRDYSNDVLFDVVGQDLSSDSYTIHVFETDEKAVLLELAAANPDNTLNWSEDTDVSTWEGISLENNRVTRISLDDQITQALPGTIGKLVHVIQLEIYNDPDNSPALSQLPPEIKYLVKLQELAIEGHQMITIPSEIGQLENLEIISLADGHLNQLPEEFAHLKMVKTLNLRSNQLTDLPITLAALGAIKVLNLSGNQLTNIPSAVFSLFSLHELYLNKNNLITVNTNIANLTNLRFLPLSDNQLTSIPKEIGSLSNLHTLNIRNNDFTVIPSEICDLQPGLTIYKDSDMHCEDE